MKSRNKDRKTHESIIGKIIYGFLLFMPLLAIAVTCLYAIFNKNAYKSYADYTQQTNIQISVVDNFEIGSQYRFNYKQSATESQSPRFMYSNISINVNNLTQDNVDYKGVAFLPNNTLRFYNENASITKDLTNIWGISIKSFTLVLNSISNIPNWSTNSNYIVYSETLINGKLSDVFYYSIDKVQESPLFNWAENSAIYTGMTTTCNALNITTPFIPLLMTYWLIISVIYILYDIILVILHIFHKKIHQLEDSF